jgi:hypothetical protein
MLFSEIIAVFVSESYGMLERIVWAKRGSFIFEPVVCVVAPVLEWAEDRSNAVEYLG